MAINVGVNFVAQNLKSVGNQIHNALNNSFRGFQRNFGPLPSGLNSKQFRQLQTDVERLGFEFGRTTQRFGVFLAAAKGLNIFIAKTSEGVKEAIDFNRQLVRLSQLGKITSSEIAGISTEITRLSTSIGASSKDLVSVAVSLKQAGFSAEETRKSLETLAKVSLAPTFKDIEKASEALIAATQQFNLSTKDIESAFGSINAVSAEFAVESEDLVKAIKTVGGAFAVSGNSSGLKGLNELLALFTSVRQTTRESADQIATGLRTIFTRVQRQDTVEQLKTLGIELRDARGQFIGAYEAFRRISQGLNQIPTTDPRFSEAIEAIGGYRQVSRVIPLIKEFSIAQKALNVAQSGTLSLNDSTIKAQAAYGVQIQKLNESFIAFFRTLSENDVIKATVNSILTLATALTKLATALAPVVPLLGALFAVRGLGKVGQFLGTRGLNITKQAVPRFNTGGKMKKYNRGTRGPANALLTPGEIVVPPGLASYDDLEKANRTGVATSSVRMAASKGFLVPGIGNVDNYPAFLPDGAFVIRKSSVNKMSANNGGLVALNSGGKFKKYADGGEKRKKKKLSEEELAFVEEIAKQYQSTSDKSKSAKRPKLSEEEQLKIMKMVENEERGRKEAEKRKTKALQQAAQADQGVLATPEEIAKRAEAERRKKARQELDNTTFTDKGINKFMKGVFGIEPPPAATESASVSTPSPATSSNRRVKIGNAQAAEEKASAQREKAIERERKAEEERAARKAANEANIDKQRQQAVIEKRQEEKRAKEAAKAIAETKEEPKVVEKQVVKPPKKTPVAREPIKQKQAPVPAPKENISVTISREVRKQKKRFKPAAQGRREPITEEIKNVVAEKVQEVQQEVIREENNKPIKRRSDAGKFPTHVKMFENAEDGIQDLIKEATDPSKKGSVINKINEEIKDVESGVAKRAKQKVETKSGKARIAALNKALAQIEPSGGQLALPAPSAPTSRTLAQRGSNFVRATPIAPGSSSALAEVVEAEFEEAGTKQAATQRRRRAKGGDRFGRELRSSSRSIRNGNIRRPGKDIQRFGGDLFDQSATARPVGHHGGGGTPAGFTFPKKFLEGKFSLGGKGALAAGALAVGTSFLPEPVGSVGASTIGGAALGAEIGGMLGPLGAAVGAATGGIIGFGVALNGFIENRRIEAFEKSIVSANDRLSALANLNKLSSSQTGELRNITDSIERSLKGFSPEKRKELLGTADINAIQTILQTISTQRALEQGSTALKFNLEAQPGSSEAIADIEKNASLLSAELRKNFSDSLFLVAEATGKSVSSLSNEIANAAAEQARVEAVRRRELALQKEVEANLIKQVVLFEGLANSTLEASESLSGVKDRLNFLGGESALRSTNFTKQAGLLGKGDLGTSALSLVSRLGPEGRGLANEGSFFAKLTNILPSILSNVDVSSPEAPEVQIRNALKENFGDMLNGQGQVVNRILNSVGSVDQADLAEKLQRDPRGFSSELLNEAGGGEINRIISEIAQQFDEVNQAFVQGLQKSIQLIEDNNNALKSRQLAEEELADVQREVAQLQNKQRFVGVAPLFNQGVPEVRKVGAGRGRGGRLNLGQAPDFVGLRVGPPSIEEQGRFIRESRAFAQTQGQRNSETALRFLTNKTAPNIQLFDRFSSAASSKVRADRIKDLAGTTNPEEIGKNFQDNQNKIIAAQEKLRRAEEDGSIDSINALQTEIAELEQNSNQLKTALQELTDTTHEANNIRRELNDIEGIRTKQRDIVEEIARGGPRAFARVSSDVQNVRFAAARGTLRGLNPIQNTQILNSLERFAELRVGGKENLLGAELKKQLLDDFQTQPGIQGIAELDNRGLDLQAKELGVNLKDVFEGATKAEGVLADIQKDNNNSFLAQLKEINNQFLIGLEKGLATNRVQAGEKNIVGANKQLQTIEKAKNDVRFLTATVGGNTLEESRNIFNNPAVQKYIAKAEEGLSLHNNFNTQSKNVTEAFADGRKGVTLKELEAITGQKFSREALKGFKKSTSFGFFEDPSRELISEGNAQALVELERQLSFVNQGLTPGDNEKTFQDRDGTLKNPYDIINETKKLTVADNARNLDKLEKNARLAGGRNLYDIATKLDDIKKAFERTSGFSSSADIKERQGRLEQQKDASAQTIIENEKTLRGQKAAELVQRQNGPISPIKFDNIPQFSDAVSDLNKNTVPFADAVNQLSSALKGANIPSTISLDYKGRVEVIINGADVLNKLNAVVGMEAIDEIKKELDNLRKQIEGKAFNGENVSIPTI